MIKISNSARTIFEKIALEDETYSEDEIRQMCDGDQGIAGEVMSLLNAYEAANSVLESPLGIKDFEPQSVSCKVGDRVQRYRIHRLIGVGGFGHVFESEQFEPVRRSVALKMLRPGYQSQEVIQRFNLESQTLAMLNHPNIARILDAGSTDQGQPFFVMDLVIGSDLDSHCNAMRLTVAERVDLMIEVSEAIHHAHQKGVIHRDLKPGNILVEEIDGAARPKVIDFGISKVLLSTNSSEPSYTRENAFIGTPSFMSPEQAINSKDIDTRSDIYSLGSILYLLVAGQPLFSFRQQQGFDLVAIQRTLSEGHRESMLSKIQKNEDKERIAGLRNTTCSRLEKISKGDLDCIVLKAVNADRERRYSSANELAQDLRRWRNGEAITARPPSFWYLTANAVRKNKRLFISLAAIGATLLVSSLFALRMANVAEANLQVAVKTAAIVLQGFASGDRLGEGQTVSVEKYAREILNGWEEIEGAAPKVDFEMYTKLGLELLDQEVLAIAKESLEKAVRSGSQIDEPLINAQVEFIEGKLAYIYARLSQFDNAKEMADEVLRTASKRELDDDEYLTFRTNAVISAYMAKSEISWGEKRFNDALRFAKDASELAQESNQVWPALNARKKIATVEFELASNKAEKDKVVESVRELVDETKLQFGESSYQRHAINHFYSQMLIGNQDWSKVKDVINENLPSFEKRLINNHKFIVESHLYRALVQRESDLKSTNLDLTQATKLLESIDEPPVKLEFLHASVHAAVSRVNCDFESSLLYQKKALQLSMNIYGAGSKQVYRANRNLFSDLEVHGMHAEAATVSKACFSYLQSESNQSTTVAAQVLNFQNAYFEQLYKSGEYQEVVTGISDLLEEFQKQEYTHAGTGNSLLRTRARALSRLGKREGLDYFFGQIDENENVSDSELRGVAGLCIASGNLEEAKELLSKVSSKSASSEFQATMLQRLKAHELLSENSDGKEKAATIVIGLNREYERLQTKSFERPDSTLPSPKPKNGRSALSNYFKKEYRRTSRLLKIAETILLLQERFELDEIEIWQANVEELKNRPVSADYYLSRDIN